MIIDRTIWRKKARACGSTSARGPAQLHWARKNEVGPTPHYHRSEEKKAKFCAQKSGFFAGVGHIMERVLEFKRKIKKDLYEKFKKKIAVQQPRWISNL
jgi:hypothetical protein